MVDNKTQNAGENKQCKYFVIYFPASGVLHPSSGKQTLAYIWSTNKQLKINSCKLKLDTWHNIFRGMDASWSLRSGLNLCRVKAAAEAGHEHKADINKFSCVFCKCTAY